ncbi:flagellin N-terminal helical domain-containing protein [Parafrigoribacterium soli]|uniref:flagellin N-terminal helical domain-containing protein n=1 Tax=Parafrigoribacterium soli TaxID=3144663 RepID=UPI0032EF90C4
MGMTINTNMSALTAYRNLSTTQNDMSKSLEKLSSGLRINRAADDAAGLAISESLKSQVGGLTVAARNAQDGISVAQTAEGTLTEVHSILQRMRDLAVQAGSDSNNTDSRTAIKTEADALKDELTRISTTTNFNGIKLLDGSAGGNTGKLTFQVGANAGTDNQIVVDLSSANVASVATALNFGVTAVKSGSVASSSLTLAAGYQFTQGSTVVTVAKPGTAATSSAEVATNLNKDTGFAQNFVASTNAAGDLVVASKTGDTNAISLKQDKTTPGTYADVVTLTAGSTSIGFDTAAAAQLSITAIDAQIKNVSTARANLGAVQNRFEHTINNLNVSKENLTASRSRITDTDMASEMVNFTRSSILSQAGTAMLAQANQSNQGVLQLLR